MIEELYKFYLDQEEPNKGCLLALRSMILDQDANITETLKWGMPCFCYKKKMFCFLWTDKKTNEPYILVVKGNLLDHDQLEQGERTRMKILRVNPNKDLKQNLIEEILQQALALY